MAGRFAGERSEAGETLLEVLIASALMGLVVVAIVGGIATVLLSSHVHREQADTNSALMSVVESIKSPTAVPRVFCAATTEPTYVTAARNAAATVGYPASAVTVTGISYENVVPDAVTGKPTVTWDSTTCHENAATKTATLQLITIKLAASDGRVSPSMTFVKGDS